jgi:Trk K+ transport system NAD-binding subunit
VELVVIFGGLVVLWLLSRSQIISRAVERSISYSLKHTGVLRALDYEQLLRVHAGYTVAEITLDADDWLTGQTIADAQLRHMGVNVLGVTSRSGAYNAQPRGATELHQGDTLIVYGSHDAIENARRKRDVEAPEVDA